MPFQILTLKRSTYCMQPSVNPSPDVKMKKRNRLQKIPYGLADANKIILNNGNNVKLSKLYTYRLKLNATYKKM